MVHQNLKFDQKIIRNEGEGEKLVFFCVLQGASTPSFLIKFFPPSHTQAPYKRPIFMYNLALKAYHWKMN